MTNLEMNQNIANFIGNYCTKWNVTVSKFAEKCNIPYMTIKRIMSCNVQKIDVYTITKIAEATRSPIPEILGIYNKNMELYKRIGCSTSYDKQIIINLLNILEKLHISGSEGREIPFADLKQDKKSYILDNKLLSSDKLDFSKMEHIAFRSSFAEGFIYFGFRLPDNQLHPHFHKNDILLAVNDDPAEGEIGIFAWKEEGYIRLIFRKVQYKQHLLELLSITGRGTKYTIDTEDMAQLMKWVVLGVVVGVIH